MTSATQRDHDVQVAIAGSLAVHLVLLSVLVWQWTAEVRELWSERNAVAREREVTLLFPEQFMEVEPPPPEPPPPVPKPALPAQQYIRTTQNTEESAAPAKADFISDRNTVAASEMAEDPNGSGPMPTQEGIEEMRFELASRDYKDGELMEDGATAVPPMMAVAAPPSVQSPPSILKPEPTPQQMVESPMTEPSTPAPFVPPPPPSQPPPADPKRVELAKSEALSPMEVMMREMDEDAARVELNRLPLEVKPAEPSEPMERPPEDVPETPELREPSEQMPPEETKEAPAEQAMPPVPKAIAVPDPVSKTAGPEDARSFSPFTRTSRAKGTITNRGEAAVNAVETPVGRYMRQVTGAVEKRWHHLRRQNSDAVTFGNLKLRFFVTRSGKVEPPEILSKPDRNNVRMIDFTLQAILEADIPPIPEDLLPLLENEQLEVEYDVLIY